MWIFVEGEPGARRGAGGAGGDLSDSRLEEGGFIQQSVSYLVKLMIWLTTCKGKKCVQIKEKICTVYFWSISETIDISLTVGLIFTNKDLWDPFFSLLKCILCLKPTEEY